MRVVNRVHHNTTDGRADALPAHAACFTPANVDLVGVSDLTNGCATANIHAADLGGGHTQHGVAAFFTKQLDGCTGGTSQLGACTGLEFHTVDHGTSGDVAQRQVVAGLDVGVRTRFDDGALRHAFGGDDVALLAITVVQQRNVCGAVRVVLNVSNLGRNTVFVVTTEVDQTVAALVSTTLVAGGDVTVGVTPTGLVQRAQQRLFWLGASDLVKTRNGAVAATRRSRLVFTNSHTI